MAKDKDKNWISLPFSGFSTKSKPADSADHDKQTNGHHGKTKGAQWELNHQKSAAEVSKMAEEEVIADYNSPIHMCMTAC